MGLPIHLPSVHEECRDTTDGPAERPTDVGRYRERAEELHE